MFLKKLAMATLVMFFASSVIPELSITTEVHAVPGASAAKKAAKAVAKAAKKAAKLAKKAAKKVAKTAKKVAKKAAKVAKKAAKTAKKVAKKAGKVAGAVGGVASGVAMDAGMKVAAGESPADALTGAVSSTTGVDVTSIGKKKRRPATQMMMPQVARKTKRQLLKSLPKNEGE